MLLVTATPHSGNEDAFRSLLSLLDEEIADLPADLDGAEREGARRRLARHLVQRRRGDIRRYLEGLRGGVERALAILGAGFTGHPKNEVLREAVRSGSLTPTGCLECRVEGAGRHRVAPRLGHDVEIKRLPIRWQQRPEWR